VQLFEDGVMLSGVLDAFDVFLETCLLEIKLPPRCIAQLVDKVYVHVNFTMNKFDMSITRQ